MSAMQVPIGFGQCVEPAEGLSLATTDHVASVGGFSGASCGRIANIGDIRRHLGAAGEACATDTELLLALLRHGGIEQFDLVAGSISTLIHDGAQLVAWCSPGAEQSLFVATGTDYAVAASHPEGMFVGKHVPRELDLNSAAHAAAQFSAPEGQSMFRGVRPVVPGEAIAFGPGDVPRTLWRWRPQRRRRSFGSLKQAGEELRHVFDLAVTDCLSGHDGQVASLLSSGRDSGAVTAAAARQLDKAGRRLVAVTGSPALGVPAPPVSDRVADEAVLAADLAGRHHNIDHLVCRAEPGSFLPKLSAIHHGAIHPIGNLSNMPWYWSATEAAHGCGCTLLLGGGAGNLTISSGGRDYLRDLAAEDDPALLLRTVLQSGGREARAWLSAANMLLGPRLPDRLYLAILKATERDLSDWRDLRILAPHVRGIAEEAFARQPREHRQGGFGWRTEQIAALVTSPVLMADYTRFEKRDPTRDLRVIELMLSMPADYLVPRPGSPRLLYEAAFGDILPARTIVGKRRGYQGADWAAQFPVEQVEGRFRELFEHPVNRELFDCNFILDVVSRRPTDPREFAQNEVINLHRNMLLAALGTADWIATNFPDA